MTRNDNLFDIVNVKFDADEVHSLVGKNVFVSNSLMLLRDAVNEMRTDSPCYYGKLLSAEEENTTHAAFKIDSDERTFRYVYYDQYYELKCALKRGETIEHRLSSNYWCIATCPSFDDKPEYYRIKSNRPVLKWQDLKIGDILRGPMNGDCGYLNDFYGMVTMIDVSASEANERHIYLGSYWINDDDICKLYRVNAAGEDIE